MKKLKYLVLAAFLMVMPGVKALNGNNFAKVEDNTQADTLEGEKTGKVTGSETANTTLTYKEGTFKLLDGSVDGRPEGYAWIGFKVTLPDNAQDVKFAGESVTPGDDHTFTDYYGFNPDKLEEALRNGEDARVGSFVLTYTVNDVKVSQTINIVVEPANIVIKDEDDTEVWDETIYTDLVEEIAAEQEELEKDDSPKTGVVDYTLIAGIIAAASMGAYLDLKKRFN